MHVVSFFIWVVFYIKFLKKLGIFWNWHNQSILYFLKRRKKLGFQCTVAFWTYLFISVWYMKGHSNNSLIVIIFFEKFELYLILLNFLFSSSFGINWYQIWPYFWAFLPKFDGIKDYKISWIKFFKNSIRHHF